MDTLELMPALINSFDKCESVANGLARCEHRFAGKLRSVFFVKATERVPSTEEVEAIQADVIAPSYFASQDDSRWNHYLVFVVPNAAIGSDLGRKSSIEMNTSYARKLVIPFAEFRNFLHRRTRLAQSRVQNTNALQALWAKSLSEANLEAVDTDRPRTEIIRSIRTGAAISAPRVAKKVSDSQPDGFISRLEIREFGTRSLSGTFDFGRVNLIRGVNGTGKTTLLESIEHFLCGATARAQGLAEQLDAKVIFKNSTRIFEYKPRQVSYYQQRDLKWYGRRVSRGNHLCEGFARYNYLNTDAPVDFSRERDQQDLTSILSRVALGPDASVTWDRIQKILSDLEPQAASASREVRRYEDQIKSAQSRLAIISEPGPELSSRSAQVKEILARLGWPDVGAGFEDPSGFESLAPLKVVIDTLPSDLPLTFDDVENELDRIDSSLNSIAALQESGRVFESRLAELNVALKTAFSLSRSVERLRDYRRVGFSELMNALSGINRQTVEEYPRREVLTKLEDNLARRATLMAVKVDATLSALEADLRFRTDHLQTVLDRATTAVESSKARSEARESLTAQLCALGRKLVNEHPSGGCPLCQSTMPAAELLARIENLIAEEGGDDVANMEEERIRASMSLSEMTEILRTVSGLAASYPMMLNHSVAQILALSKEAEDRKAKIDSERKNLTARMMQLQSEGYGMPELMGILARCSAEISPDLNEMPHSDSTLNSATERAALKGKAISNQLDEARAALEANSLALTKIAISSSGESQAEEAKKILLSRRSEVTRFIGAFDRLPESARTIGSQNLRDFFNLAEVAYSQVIQISDDFAAATSRNEECTALSVELATRQAEHARLKNELNRMVEASDALKKIAEDHSLEKGLSDFLLSNLDSIQSIFERIHVPNELRLSNLAGCDLIRVSDGGVNSLSQISTGQRAALVLSVFLTLNSSLREGPPMMLIDDPVAHIDDMNSLALLDYLADVAEAGQRQIFFATADDKLANLFMKKMSFLGDDFKAISLTRRIASLASIH